MRKTGFFFLVLSLFLLVPALITRAQKISSQKGLTTAEFDLPQGKIKIYLPDDIRQGDVISGTVVAEPGGNNERQTARNLEELIKYTVRIDGNKCLVAENPAMFKWLVAANRPLTAPIELLNVSAVKVAEMTYPSIRPVMSTDPVLYDCAIPSHALTGAPMQIKGSFDGDASNTKCSLGNKPLNILTESPRQICTPVPIDIADPGGNRAVLSVQENGKPACTNNISLVDMQVTTGGLNLRKGQNTYIEVKLTGLQNLPDTALLTITNLTPNVVTMTNGNIQVIPISPPADSAGGRFTFYCPAVSISTGSFVVNINLDLPQDVMLSPAPDDNPQGNQQNDPSNNPVVVQGSKCKCTVKALVSFMRIENDIITYMAMPVAGCSGPECAYQSNNKFKWQLVSGSISGEIIETTDNGFTIKVRQKNNGNFIIKNTATVTCSDGTTCTDDVFFNEKGEEVPAEEDEPGETVSQPGKEKDGGGKSCKCGAKVKITEEADRGSEMDFKAEALAECTGVYGSGVNTFLVCDVLKKTFSWFIKDGKEEAEIKGGAGGETVTVTRKTGKAFTLAVKLIVVCLDGGTCEAEDEVSVPETPSLKSLCGFHLKHSDPVKMDGGLLSKYIVSGMKIKRDDFVALGAEGGDYDLVTLICKKENPCQDETETKQYVLNGRVRFEWHIINGDGRFVSLGSLPEKLAADGDQAIFRPPALPLPVMTADTVAVTNILLHIIDDNPGQPQDVKVNRMITITVRRNKLHPDHYFVDVSSKDKYKLPTPPAISNKGGTCKVIAVPWIPAKDLAAPVIALPEVEGNSTIINGQWLILRVTNKEDMDKLNAHCKSSSNPPCITSGGVNRGYGDNIAYTWEVTAGEGAFITGNGNNLANALVTTGGYVLFAAPSDLKGKDKMSITITCKGFNPDKGLRDDGETAVGKIVLTVYQGGVKISPVTLTWLPEAENDTVLTSTLHYKTTTDGRTVWNPAPLHFKRIHFFQMTDVSNETGICMNDPLPEKAKKARDLKLKPAAGMEVFDDGDIKKIPENKEYFLQAKTIAPRTTATLKVYSEDYGAYGFLRSFANTFDKEKGVPVGAKTGAQDKRNTDEPLYVSVPLIQSEVQHPSMAMGRGKYDHPDNRVSIPRDVDGNHIADGGWTGWTSKGEKELPDPPFMENDVDEEPVGDKFNGDGLTNYEEYRGFMYQKASIEKTGTEVVLMDKPTHRRTNHEIKTIFIRNKHPEVLKLDLYKTITGLEVVEINAVQYQSDDIRVVNFNFNTKATHVVDQKGLFLVNGGMDDKLLGIANTKTKNPTRPNEVTSVVIYRDKVQLHVDEINKKVDEFNADIEKRKKKAGGYKHLVMEDKMAAVVAHELLHANNVCHHGEGNEKLDVSHDAMNGLRSGDISCVMRYDNTGTKIKDTAYYPEIPGTALCTSPIGTSYNTPGVVPDGERKVKVEDRGYGNCAPGRGSCAFQIRVSGVGIMPPHCPKPK